MSRREQIKKLVEVSEEINRLRLKVRHEVVPLLPAGTSLGLATNAVDRLAEADQQINLAIKERQTP